MSWISEVTEILVDQQRTNDLVVDAFETTLALAAAQDSRIAALEARIAALENPPAPPTLPTEPK